MSRGPVGAEVRLEGLPECAKDVGFTLNGAEWHGLALGRGETGSD